MKVLVDSNVILDVLMQREPFFEDSNLAIEKLLKNGDKLYVSASCITDIYYLLRKKIGDHLKTIDKIRKLVAVFDIAEVNQHCIIKALKSKIVDFEDAVVDSVASDIKANIILTRNEKDFKEADNKICIPSQFKGMRKMTPEELKNHYVGKQIRNS